MSVWEVSSSVAAVVSAIAAAFAAGFSWRTASRSHALTSQLASLEFDRRLDELQPSFRCDFERINPESKTAVLRLVASRPVSLEALDHVLVEVRWDGKRRWRTEDAPSDLAEEAWGPLQFCVGIDGTPSPGRTSPRALQIGEPAYFQMELSTPPATSAWEASSWRAEFAKAPVLLTIVARKDGLREWRVPKELPSPSFKSDRNRGLW